MSTKVSVIIPAHNEEERIGKVLQEVKSYVDEVIVIDDGSIDNTSEVSSANGARVIRQNNSGYIKSILKGFREVTGDIFVTMDADGEHNPEDIPRLIQPILKGKADIVLGKRWHIAIPTERFLSWLTSWRIPLYDTGTGFRALTREVAQKLTIPGKCICVTSVLEYYSLGAKVVEVPFSLRPVAKPRKIAWEHISQFFIILRWLCKGEAKNWKRKTAG